MGSLKHAFELQSERRMSAKPVPDLTAVQLRAMNHKLSRYLELQPEDDEARFLSERCGQIAEWLETQPSGRVPDGFFDALEDRVLRVASGAPLTRRELRFAGIFALTWFAMDAFWFISTLNGWFGL
jgi:hypothetical protein